MEVTFNLRDMGPCSPHYVKLATFILFIFGLKLLGVAISLFAEYFLSKRFFAKNKPFFLLPEPNKNLSEFKEKQPGEGSFVFFKRITLGFLEKITFGFLEIILLKKECVSFSFFKKEFARLVQFAEKNRNIYEILGMRSLFFSSVKENIFKRMTTIFTAIGISILALFYVIIMGINSTAQGIEYSSEIKNRFLVFVLEETLFIPGIFLIIILLLCLFVYRSIKKKYYLIVDETNKWVDQLNPEKCSEVKGIGDSQK